MKNVRESKPQPCWCEATNSAIEAACISWWLLTLNYCNYFVRNYKFYINFNKRIIGYQPWYWYVNNLSLTATVVCWNGHLMFKRRWVLNCLWKVFQCQDQWRMHKKRRIIQKLISVICQMPGQMITSAFATWNQWSHSCQLHANCVMMRSYTKWWCLKQR